MMKICFKFYLNRIRNSSISIDMTKVLILGGGFSGIGVAQKLEKLITKKNKLDIAMVSDTNYFMFQPMLPGVAAGSIEASHIINPIRRLCKKTTFHRASVDEIDLDNKKVKIVEKDITREHWLEFDHLVIAMGLSTDMTRVPGMNEHSLPMRTLGDAIFLRNEIINKLEMAAIEKDAEVKSRLLTFVFVGGGFSGVETMGEVGDMIKSALKNYPSITKNEIRLVLVHSGDRILKELGEKVALFAQKKLRKRGMELRLDSRVKEVTPDAVILSNDDVIPARTVVCTTGNAPHKVLTTLSFINKHGRLDTDEFFRVVQRNENQGIAQTFDTIWALGDCAFTPNLKEIKKNPEARCPPTAQFAVRMAPVLAKNIVATMKGKKLKKFAFKELGQMAVIGHLCGIAEVMGIRFSGVLAFFMWRAIYWVKLPGIYCKFRVLFDWIIHAFFPVDITQLDVYRTEKVTRSHYQEGSYVFREGEIADYFYVIEEGEVEIVKTNHDQTETIVAMLKTGDSFGEMGLMQKAPRSASVRCVTPVDLLKISREDFKALSGSYTTLKDQLETRVSEINRSNAINNGDDVLDPLADIEIRPDGEIGVDDTNEEPPRFSETFQDELHHQSEHSLTMLEKELEKKLYKEPNNPVYLRQYAELQNHFGYIENALTLYYQYLAMHPNDVKVMARVGDMHRRLAQFDSCIKILEKAYALDPKSQFVISNLASAYRSKKHYNKARELLQKGLEFNPHNPNIMVLLAQCYNKQKQPERGEETIRKQLYVTPNHIPALIVLTESLLLQSRFIDAESFLNQANQLDLQNRYVTPIKKLRQIIQKSYDNQLISRND
jgi:NADH dehydrogenase